MKLDLPEIQIEKSGSFTTQQFAFGDQRVIMEILRSRMYSNPIKTICQEISSNARDAHREAGHNEPIVVKLPSWSDKSFFIRDYGIGISPDRMANVFIKYGNSTKRNDNIQTGGFGLGAKSPFSYTDTFTIVTITKEENSNVKREYVAFIDETGIGSMSLLKEEPTESRTGTTISITPRDGDERQFRDNILEICKFWTVKPEVITDDPIEWEALETIYSCSEWALLARGKPTVLIDEIPYPLSGMPVDANESSEVRAVRKLPILIYAKTGELRVTAQRDSVDFQPEAVKFLYDKLNNIVQNLNKVTSAKLDAFDDYWEARLFFNKNFTQWPISPLWKGKKLDSNYKFEDGVISEIFKYSTDYRGTMRKHMLSDFEVKEGINVNNDTKLIELDQASLPNNSYMGKIFKQLGNYKYFYVIRFSPNLKPSSLKIVKLSEVKAAMSKSTPPVSTGSNIPKITYVSSSPKHLWKSVPLDYQAGGYYVPTVHGKIKFKHKDKDGIEVEKDYDLDTLRDLQHSLNIEIACISKQYIGKLKPNWINAFDHAKATLKKLESDLPKELESGDGRIGDWYHSSFINFIKNNRSKLSKDNIILQWIDESDNVDKYIIESTRKFNLYVSLAYKLLELPIQVEAVKNTLNTYEARVKEMYPLLDIIQNGYSSLLHEPLKATIKAAENAIIEYINQLDPTYIPKN